MPRCVNTRSSGSTNWSDWAPETMSSVISNGGTGHLPLSELIATTSPASATPTTDQETTLSSKPAPLSHALAQPKSSAETTTERDDLDTAALSEAPAVSSLDPSDAAETARTRLEQAVDKYKQAQLQAGVDVARAGFMKKLWSLAASSAMLAAATIASVASLGVATPLLAVACVNMAISVGDVGCAWMTHRNALAAKDGAPEPPYPNVKMGGNCLANLVYPAALRKCKSDEDARKVATGVADCLKGGLMIASFTMGCLSPVHMAAAGSALKATAASMKLLLGGYMVKHPQNVGAPLARATQIMKNSEPTFDPALLKAVVLLGAQLKGLDENKKVSATDTKAADDALKQRTRLQLETVLYALQGISSTRHLAGLALAEVGIGLDEVVVGGVVEGAHAVAAGAGSVGAFVAQLGAVLDWLG